MDPFVDYAWDARTHERCGLRVCAKITSGFGGSAARPAERHAQPETPLFAAENRRPQREQFH
jgi:hypothetical protein